jgi:hypothetical protein
MKLKCCFVLRPFEFGFLCAVDSPPATTTQSLMSSSSAPAVTSAPSTNATVPTSPPTLLTTSIIIIVCSIGGAALIAIIVAITYFISRRSTNPTSAAEPKSASFSTSFVGLSHRTKIGSGMPNASENFPRTRFQNSAYLNSGYQDYGHGGHGNFARATNYHHSPSYDVTDQHVAKAYNRSLY